MATKMDEQLVDHVDATYSLAKVINFIWPKLFHLAKVLATTKLKF